ncbi:MAG: hypothetical protein JO057_07820 [Chloroflexi bacterium]|nr:hypothetical protein [Chloroflexota bacterium]
MPTVAELVRSDGSLGMDVCAGASGLAREISRIVRSSTERIDIPLRTGDVVLVSARDWRHALNALDLAGSLQVAAVIVSATAHDSAQWLTDSWSTPVLLLSEPRLDQAFPLLTEWLEQCTLHEEHQAVEFRQRFGEMDVHADMRAITERLVQVAGRPVFIHDAHGHVELTCQPATRRLASGDFDATVRVASATVGGRASRGRFPLIGVAYDEIPALDCALISLATGSRSLPVHYVSMLGQAADFTHPDRAALGAAFQLKPELAHAQSSTEAHWDTQVVDLLLGGRIHRLRRAPGVA